MSLLALPLKLPRWVYALVGGIVAVGLLWTLHAHWERKAYNVAYNAGWNALAAKDEAAAARSRATNAKAVAAADSERANENTNISTDKEARDVAIKTAPASATGAATRAANCVRWARAHPGREAPSACR